MTETELKQSIAQAEQDAVTLDYSKWSAEQRRANLSTDHGLWQQQRDRVLSRQQSDNAEARKRYLAGLDTAKQSKQAQTDAAIDAELEPQKQMLMREWLANHPGKSIDDFNKSAWIHLRQNLVEQRNTNAMEATKQQMASTGRYSL